MGSDARQLGPDHPSIAIQLNNLALLYQDSGRYAEAEPLYERALAIDEKALGSDHPNLAIPLSNLALLCLASGRYPEVAPLYKRAITILEKTLPPAIPT